MASSFAHTKNIRKRVRAVEPEADPEFQIAPMIDILLVLLVFFMSISSTEVLQSTGGIDLPVAKDAKDAKSNPGQVIVNIAFNAATSTPTITVQETTYSLAELVALLRTQVQRNPLSRVVIRADKLVRYDFLRRILEAIGAAGIGNVTFSVVDKDSPSTPN